MPTDLGRKVDDSLRDARKSLGSSAMAVYIFKKSWDNKMSAEDKEKSLGVPEDEGMPPIIPEDEGTPPVGLLWPRLRHRRRRAAEDHPEHEILVQRPPSAQRP